MAWVVRGEFRKLWVGQLVSASGSAITTVALPLVAVVTLQASAVEMGVLAALTLLPHLLFGLPAGVWVDRWSLRRVLVVSDVGRAVLLGSVPLAAAVGSLHMWQLYVVAVLTGALTLLSDTASMTLQPALVPREDLMRANSAVLLNLNIASTAGPSVTGFLVQVVSAPFAIVFDAASYVVSAVASYLIREPPRGPAAGPGVQLTAGLRTLFGHPVLRPLVVSATIGAIAGSLQGPLVVLYLVRERHWPAGLVGVAITVFGVAAVAGSLVVPAWTRRLGIGRAYISGQLLASLSGVALALGAGPFIYLGQALSGLGMSLFGVPQRTVRQSLAPPHLLGQVSATWRTLVIGGQSLGALTSGLLATTIGIRPTLILSTYGILTGALVATLSPIRTVRTLPEQAGDPVAGKDDKQEIR
ncbi:putative MFS family arabinose efflux permease [Kribbella antiqua]|uniref:Putative MFS family arabinose efflux permease n=1 Tax=Kribbella antiqua TaxID=2512217 RepID=A0A4R2IKG0_9ACTN|nr:MFS transporter [Kribbella antiqua]TCO44912.1 putative MFS family arabinose efflux permease [Kribbella antiqua]